ncbi:hypothetical protein ACVQ92_13005 [Staphylococcus aureus]
MFDNNPQNYQAKGNVAALGRVNANDSTDHGNFNGITKTVNVKPDSEIKLLTLLLCKPVSKVQQI